MILHSMADAAEWMPRLNSQDYFLQNTFPATRSAPPTCCCAGRIVHAYTVTFDMGDRPFVKGNGASTAR